MDCYFSTLIHRCNQTVGHEFQQNVQWLQYKYSFPHFLMETSTLLNVVLFLGSQELPGFSTDV